MEYDKNYGFIYDYWVFGEEKIYNENENENENEKKSENILQLIDKYLKTDSNFLIGDFYI